MNTSAKDDKKTPAWLLERLAQGELDAAETETLRARLLAEGRSLDDELAALERSNRDILAARPKDVVGAAIRRRIDEATISKPRRSRLNVWIAPLALAGSLGIGVLALRPWGHAGSGMHQTPPPAGADEVIQFKGDAPAEAPQLLVYRQRSAGMNDAQNERLADGALAARGDLVQLAYKRARDGIYGVLLSIDGAGRVTQHLPEEGARQAAPLRSLREFPLPSAYELDDAPSFERFVLVTSSQPFTVATVRDAARSLATRATDAQTLPLALAPAFHQTSVLLHKTSKGTP
jgi:hypothetical protein